MIGTTLAHYRITAALGAGGMGEVWRATDEKLGREVALKVLPEEFAKDPDRMARFEREAKVLASLNNPNIAHLYGLESVNTQMAAGTAAPQGSADGFAGTTNSGPVGAEPEGRRPMAHASRVQAEDSETSLDVESSPKPQAPGPTVTFLVMELVEGEDLSERIKRGPIPSTKPFPSRSRSRRRWRRRTSRASSTAISNRPTSRSPTRARSRCWTSGSLRRGRTKAPI